MTWKNRSRAAVSVAGETGSWLTYDAWDGVLPAHWLIVVYRLPEEGWAHYWSAAGGPARKLDVLRRFLGSWCEYNAAILGILARATVPAIVLHYTRLMEGDDELRRLERFVGRPRRSQRPSPPAAADRGAAGLAGWAEGAPHRGFTLDASRGDPDTPAPVRWPRWRR